MVSSGHLSAALTLLVITTTCLSGIKAQFGTDYIRYSCWSTTHNISATGCLYFGSGQSYGCCFDLDDNFRLELTCAIGGTYCSSGRFVVPVLTSGTIPPAVRQTTPRRINATRRPAITKRPATTRRPVATRRPTRISCTSTSIIENYLCRSRQQIRTTQSYKWTTTTEYPYRTYAGNSQNRYKNFSPISTPSNVLIGVVAAIAMLLG